MRKETGGPFGGRGWFTENGGLDHRKQMPDYRQGGRSGDAGTLCTAGFSERSEWSYLDVGVGERDRDILVFAWRTACKHSGRETRPVERKPNTGARY